MYYGDELGMHDVHIPPEMVQDPFEKNVPGMGHGRDPERTPMQWDSGPNAGFTMGTPWLPLAHDFGLVNVSKQMDDPSSTLNFYRRLIKLRKKTLALYDGVYSKVLADDHLFIYSREGRGEKYLVALNFSGVERILVIEKGGFILISTHLDREGEEVDEGLLLRPNEGIVLKVFMPGI